MCGTQVEVQIIYRQTDGRISTVFSPEKGICLPTVFLWLLFVYIEAAIRLKVNIHSKYPPSTIIFSFIFHLSYFPFQWSVQEYKLHIDVKNLPFHLDLCRPFAAHWWVREFKKLEIRK